LIHIVLLLAGPPRRAQRSHIDDRPFEGVCHPDVLASVLNQQTRGRNEYSIGHKKTAGANARGGSWSVQRGGSYSLP
jgi:hypothetical protein